MRDTGPYFNATTRSNVPAPSNAAQVAFDATDLAGEIPGVMKELLPAS
ncbi:MAG: hypothetical protein Q8L37_03370 [Candidatus Gottesmanbacteria bacterium]|nr:hypothetical protein [Candidatus Gottesmanbacteria bacterium]